MKRFGIILFFFGTIFCTTTMNGIAQEESKLKISGYIQGQWQYGQKDSKPTVGKYTNGEDDISRIGIRRGRLKFTYTESFAKAVIQIDATEKGIGFKDAYLELMYPSFEWIRFRGGIFDRPFGHEIRYSSTLRETPERSNIFLTLFPQERDLGGMLIVQAPKNHALHFLKLEGGLFAGNGIKQDNDNKKDFIGRLSAEKNIGNLKLSGGVSTYLGKVKTVNDTTYQSISNGFEVDSKYTSGDYLNRRYFGVDAQIEYKYVLGTTTLRGEYLFGEQPGTRNSSKSPNSSELPDVSTQYYLRDLSGGSITLVHGFGQKKTSMHTLALKYDFYNPNTKVSAGAADLAFNTFTVAYIFAPHERIRLMAAYEFWNNETSESIEGYKSNREDNLFTLRLQYRF